MKEEGKGGVEEGGGERRGEEEMISYIIHSL
jgi:hypothetical protein